MTSLKVEGNRAKKVLAALQNAQLKIEDGSPNYGEIIEQIIAARHNVNRIKASLAKKKRPKKRKLNG